MFRTVLFFGFLTGILLGVGWFLGGFFGMTVALFLSLLINFISYWYSDKIVLTMYGAKETNDPELNKIVENLAFQAGIPKPKVYIVPTKIPNAFATGRSPKHSSVAVTEGLLELNKDEIEGVLSHEIAHIRNHDILISTAAATISGAISYLAQIGYYSLFFRDSREGGNLFGLLFVIIFAPLAALLVRLAISRSFEYRADYTGAIISKKPLALASALEKISSITKNHPMRGSAATSHLWIVNPFKSDWFTNLFSTHPPIEERIKRLKKMAV